MKFGRKNEIKLDPLAYNLMLIGESGIGKTTVIKNYVEKIAGPDGYLFVETGHEDGGDAIDGLNYVTATSWDDDYDEEMNTIGFKTLVDDIVENKTSDWKDLRVLVIDTLDELFSALAEPEVIRMHNKENPNKRVKSIKAAFGGFQAGEEMAVKIVQDALWSLKSIGVSFVIIGHTKTRNLTDPVTGEDYMMLTTNMPQRYFNALKTKVHFLGVASIDREIVREKGKKNIVTGQMASKGVVKSETRKITFRDDNYSIDSKSRFADIVSEIPLDADALEEAIMGAIKSAQSKSGVPLDVAAKKQEKEKESFESRVAENEKSAKAQKELDSVVDEIVNFFTENKSNLDKIKPVLKAVKDAGYDNPKSIDDIEFAKSILNMTR